MRIHKQHFRMALTIAAAMFVLAWALIATRGYVFSGANFEFRLGTGNVILTNYSDEAASVQLRAGRRDGFTVASDSLDLVVASSLGETKKGMMQTVEFKLPTGETDLRVVQGNKIWLAIQSADKVEARGISWSSSQIVAFWSISTLLIVFLLAYPASQIVRFSLVQWRGRIMRRSGAERASV